MFSIKLMSALKHPLSSANRKRYRCKMSAKLFHQFAPEALKKLSSAIQLYNQEHQDNPVSIWLSFGTLLGAYRENGIIAHDLDIDFGIDENSFSIDFLQFVARYDDNFRLIKTFQIHSNNADLDNFISEATLRYKDCVNIDFFIFKTLNGKKFSHCFEIEQGLTYKEHQQKYGQYLRVCQYKFNDFSLKEVEFMGTKFNIPSNTTEHLTEMYGKDFMIPKKYNYDDRPRDFETLLDENTLASVYYY